MAEYTTIAEVGSIAEGKSAVFKVQGRMIAVFNVGGQYHAIDDFCPHMGASLAEGHVEEDTVTCPWHAWRFRVTDGTWCDNPRIKIDAFPVRLEGNQIQVLVEEKPPLP
ncbi:MAG: Rieske 2Fe-2S domain-containing protein [Planctomycetales bacterium]|nr:Rieske 2Fe-2S domain-containing protein [Planctomycetales bacterium]